MVFIVPPTEQRSTEKIDERGDLVWNTAFSYLLRCTLLYRRIIV